MTVGKEDNGHDGSDDNVLVMEQAEIHENNNSIDVMEEAEIHENDNSIDMVEEAQIQANSVSIDTVEEAGPREVEQSRQAPVQMADRQAYQSRQGPDGMTYGQPGQLGNHSVMMSGQQDQHSYPHAMMSGQPGQLGNPAMMNGSPGPPAQYQSYPPAPVQTWRGQPTPSYPFNASAQFHVTPPPVGLSQFYMAKRRENKERHEAEKRREDSRQWEARMRQELCQECVSKRKTLTHLQHASLFNTLLCQKVCSTCSIWWPVMFFNHRYDVSAGRYVPAEDTTCLGQSRSVRLCMHRTFNMTEIQREYRRVTEAGPLPKTKETILAKCEECFEGLGAPLQSPRLITVGIGKGGEEGRKFDLSWHIKLDWIKDGEEEDYRHLICPHRSWIVIRDWATKGVAAAAADAAQETAAQGKAAQDKTAQDKTAQGKADQGKAAQGKTATVPNTGKLVCNLFGCKREYSWSKNNSGQPLVKSRLKILKLWKGQDLSHAGLDPHMVELLPEDLVRLESADKKHVLWCDNEAEKPCLNKWDRRRALYHHTYWLLNDDYWPNEKVLAEERARDEQEGRSSPGQDEHTFPSRKETLFTIQEEDLYSSQEENLNSSQELQSASSQELQSASSQEEDVSPPQKECPFRHSVSYSERPRSRSCSPGDHRKSRSA
ncbi:hypothetical protein CSOJ01_13079 [Colletotrichum sojae]|uniref:Uncharacterized protein n=1 Tax=Colletotrichum sojae TaxID=2175907 RepID=A0A8H6ITY0_9PEZI|nr:hypothetical protein CSOJ01_13079 [Colletotrichum sojae]